ncbi:CTB family bacteriocin [Nostoc sp. LEGE 12447]|uniref:CTB family bacteriocin n=1 Tax=Nostoc sp. LEGE 12447 TaxID=1828640 RepID=UPI001883B622|nr:CTB family bacteriocin [Nostoc sp. LEGE 12447]MBE8998142.1 CTB family bacteriocin [Nostoc sp. LEGE 12447]MBE8998143.1 CTB family bacteriocin [Nostoc sp. LEGE 12447]
MSDNIQPIELSSEELDNVAGGAFSFVDADNYNAIDQQGGATVIGANGGISSLNTQQTAVSHQSLHEIKATGLFPSTLEN